MQNITRALEAARTILPDVKISPDERMSAHTSFRIGGAVRAMLLPQSAGELTALTGVFRELGVRTLVIGNGTNLLIEDGELDMVVIKTTGISDILAEGDTRIRAGCGAPLSRIAVYAAERGLAGFEFAHGIPGSLGGATLMNAGAYGGEMKGVIIETRTVGMDGAELIVTGAEHDFKYRHSRFSDTGEIVLSSLIELAPDDGRDIRARMDDLAAKRRESQPLNLPSAGSAFKRPPNGYAAAFIEQAGLKGYTVGGAQVSEKHSGFIVNRGGATFNDVMAVLDHVRETVYKAFGVELTPEIRIIRGNGATG